LSDRDRRRRDPPIATQCRKKYWAIDWNAVEMEAQARQYVICKKNVRKPDAITVIRPRHSLGSVGE
jgi:hypothetical protein